MMKSKHIRVPVEQCHRKKKHKAHLHAKMFGTEHHSIYWCRGVRK